MASNTAAVIGKKVAEKKRWMYDRYGGIMSPADLARELGWAKVAPAEQWAKDRGIEPISLGPRKRGYEVDLVAKAIVYARGMC